MFGSKVPRDPGPVGSFMTWVHVPGEAQVRARSSRLVPALAMLTAAGVGGSLFVTPATADEERPRSVHVDQVASSEAAERAKPQRAVMVVGNNWEGTVTVVDAHTHEVLEKSINVVPDLDEELQQVRTPSESHPAGPAYYYAIQQVVAEGHDQYVDDIFTTRNGRFLAVSRPSLHDVVWIDIAKAAAGGKDGDVDSIVAEQDMDGYRTDHMGVSPDRRRLLVSDSTAKQVIEFSMVGKTMGRRLRTFESGETPHENNYSEDGSRIFHASIGRVYTPGDYPDFGVVTVDDLDGEFVHDNVKADRWLQIVDNETFDVTHRWDMGLELEEVGHPQMSSAVRPVAVTPDEKIMYAQVSFFHGLVEFNMVKPDVQDSADYTLGGLAEPEVGRVTRLVDLPVADEVKEMRREDYVLDSAHHGLAINESGRKLCVSGTMSDYAAIVDRATFTPKVFKGAARYVEGRKYSKPYWATEGPGNTCWMSMSGSDLVTVISFHKEKVIAEVEVGDHPQRVREGHIRESIVERF